MRIARYAIAIVLLALAAPTPAQAACSNPPGDEAKIVFNSSTAQFQYCDDTNWIAMHPPPPSSAPTGCPIIGNTCSDGSKYAGLSPDGNVPMYTTPADAGQFTWDDGTNNWLDTAMENCTTAPPGAQASCRTGAANTALLVGLGTATSPAPYVAARHCDALIAHGQTDWYLPAQDELNVLFINRAAIGGFNLSGTAPAGWYWSSSEESDELLRMGNFATGVGGNGIKSDPFAIRCVRKVGGSAPCTNPSGAEGQMIYNPDNRVLQGCAGGAWRALGPIQAAPLPPDNCDTIGEVCSDGSVYAGLSPDGNEPMYTTPADAGRFSWNDGSTNGVDTAMQNCTTVTPGSQASCQTGAANTALLVGLGTTPSPAPFVAARYCSDLAPPTAEAFGHDDWYLPAQDELDVLFDNRVAIGGFDVGGSDPTGRYWSSSEFNHDHARIEIFSDGTQNFNFKNTGHSVRCTRKQSTFVVNTPACTAPEGQPGAVIYNSDWKVLQYCDGVNWVSIGKEGVDPCDGSPAPGQVCGDGTVYAGLSPDGNVPMYTTPADAGQFSWNDGSTNNVDTAMQNCVSVTPSPEASCQTGEANTALLAGLGTTPSPAPYVAARYCSDLAPPTAEAFGHDDWYLPAQDELDVLYDNRVAIGGFNVSGSYPAGTYWSSSERDAFGARAQVFSHGGQYNPSKNDGDSVRCVRK